MNEPIKIHPQNNKLFQFRGKPLMLVCATEHYGAVINRPFDFTKYLADAYEKKQTLTRLFVLFRELQNAINPYSTCKPESPDYIAPFKRVGPETALDGQPKFDLDKWNPEFFERLHHFLGLASEYGIIVEITLLSNTYAPEIWALNPFNSKNNINGLDEIEWMDYNTERHSELFERQIAHVRKIVEETNRYDNIIYEICNEPGAQFPGNASHPGTSEVNEWQMKIARTIRETEVGLPHKHLIAGQEAFTYEPWEQSSDYSFGRFDVDIVNIHPLPNTTFSGKGYEMGLFMSKQLKLREFRDYCRATYGGRKPLNLDEDNIASQYKDYEGWTIHRKRAWMALLNGSHYDYIDFSIINYCETGTKESKKHIRSWIKYLSEMVHSLDLAKAKPVSDLLIVQPANTLESVLAVEHQDYLIYLADDRELFEQGAGDPINGVIRLSVPEGRFSVSSFSPQTGMSSPAWLMQGGMEWELALPEFQHDIAVRIKRVNISTLQQK